MIRVVAALVLGVALAGCGESAEQMLATAELEEVQQNTVHARELYERIVRDHPDTPEAAKAAARLKNLEPKPGP